MPSTRKYGIIITDQDVIHGIQIFYEEVFMSKRKKVLSMLLAMAMLMTSIVLPVSADSANVTENVTSLSATEFDEPEATAPYVSEAASTKNDTSSN